MTRTSPVSIAGLGLWLPEFPSVAAWSAQTPDPESSKPLGRALDRRFRRRGSLLGRALADVTAEAMEQAGVDPAEIPTIIGSSIGEVTTMLGLLDQTWRTHTPMSPAAFSVSVHNAASGLISISNQNQGFATSLAADETTPASALLEGIGLVLTSGRPVVVACGDEMAPKDLVPGNAGWELLAAAVVLSPSEADGSALATLSITREPRTPLNPASLAPELALNPQAGLVDLVDAVLRGEPGTVRLDRGKGRGFFAEIGGGDDR